MKYLLRTPNSKRKFFIFIGDFVFIIATTLATFFLFQFLKEYCSLKILNRPLKLYIIYPSVVSYLIMLYIFGMYEIQRKYEKLHLFISISLTALLSFCFVFGLAKVIRINKTTMVCSFISYFFSIWFIYYWRLASRRLLLRSRGIIKDRILFIGTDQITAEILREIAYRDYNVCGVISTGGDVPNNSDSLHTVWSSKELPDVIRSRNVSLLITASSKNFPLPLMKQIYKYKFRNIKTFDSASFYEMIAKKVAVKHYLENDQIPYFDMDIFVRPIFKNVKRLIDVAGSGLSLIALSPVFITIAMLIKLTSKGPAFFFQERIGFQEKPFSLIKFRTMVNDAESDTGPQWASKEDDRVTKVGKFLRKTRLDELPQLINILRGDMSFVGPRPIRQYFANIIEEQMPFYSLRFTIKPGLTGWTQVNIDYGGTVEGHIEKFQYDLYYIKYASLFIDLFILLKTINTVLRKSPH